MSGKSNRQPGRTRRARRRRRNEFERALRDGCDPHLSGFAAPRHHREGALSTTPRAAHRRLPSPSRSRPPSRPRPGRTRMYRIDVDPPKHAVRADTRAIDPARPAPLPLSLGRRPNPALSHDAHTSHSIRMIRQPDRAGPPSGAVRKAASRMIGGPSSPDADADVSSALPTHVSKAAHEPVASKPRSARARVPRRDTPRSPLTRDLFDGGGHGTSESDDLDEDDLAAIARGLEQRTAALKLEVRAKLARRIGAVDAALAKLQLAVALRATLPPSNVSRTSLERPSNVSTPPTTPRRAPPPKVTGPGASRTRGTGAGFSTASASTSRRRRDRSAPRWTRGCAPRRTRCFEARRGSPPKQRQRGTS